ncbi:MAG: hypothetical protein AABX88_02500 [Nanoarchaeota archaeon]
MKNKTKEILHELKHHIPFTIFAVTTAIASFFLLHFFNKQETISLFYSMHEIHLFASAMVTAAMFYRYENNFIRALLIGVTGSIIIGSLSDILVPYLGGIALGLKTSFHLPLIEKPVIILSILFLGSIVGITTKFTKFPHAIHIFVSVFASLFYLTLFSQPISAIFFLMVSVIVFVAVIIPCCMSDIVFPFLFLNQKIKSCGC